jgi:hypothetical protein
MKRARSHGPTGYWFSFVFDDFGTLPRIVTYLLAFSLAMRILCGGAIFVVVVISFSLYKLILLFLIKILLKYIN